MQGERISDRHFYFEGVIKYICIFRLFATRYTVRNICGEQCKITIDTVDVHYWNYKIDPKIMDISWGDTVYSNFYNFEQPSLKICVEIFDEEKAKRLIESLPECDCARFSDGYWYKFTKKGITKKNAIEEVCKACNINASEIISFGDDYADIEMLQASGLGIAMGNAIPEVKEISDVVIGSNDEDGIAKWLESSIVKTSKNERILIDDLYT